MAVSTRVIRSRIKSVQSTKKITKAMELVSAAKMRRAVQSVLGSRPYATLSWEVIAQLSALTKNGTHPLMDRREPVKKLLLFIVMSDRGLCGGFNAQLLKCAVQYMRVMQSANILFDVATVGRRAELAVKKLGWPLVASFASKGNALTFADLMPMAQLAQEGFLRNEYDRVLMAHTDFISSLRQEPRVRQLLPLGHALELGNAHLSSEQPSKIEHFVGTVQEYIFEPSPEAVLDAMLPRFLEAQLYQSLLESNASEHAARMMAMQSASKAAEEFIDDLTFSFNQARQAGITREIAEISSGAIALQ